MKFTFSKFAGLQVYSQQLYYQMNSFTVILQQHFKPPPMLPPFLDLSPPPSNFEEPPLPPYSQHLWETLFIVKDVANKKRIFNVNQSFQTIMHRTVTYSMFIYFKYLLYYLPSTEMKLKFQGHSSRRRMYFRNFPPNK